LSARSITASAATRAADPATPRGRGNISAIPFDTGCASSLRVVQHGASSTRQRPGRRCALTGHSISETLNKRPRDPNILRIPDIIASRNGDLSTLQHGRQGDAAMRRGIDPQYQRSCSKATTRGIDVGFLVRAAA